MRHLLGLSLAGCLLSACNSGPSHDVYLSVIGAAPFPDGAQAFVFGELPPRSHDLGCVRQISTFDSEKILRLIRDSSDVLAAPEIQSQITLLHGDHTVLVDASGRFAGTFAYGRQEWGRDFNGDLYPLSLEQFIEIVDVSEGILRSYGCDI